MQPLCQEVGALSLEAHAGVPVLTFPGLAGSGVVAHAILTRLGGVSLPPFDSLNVSVIGGDDPVAVEANTTRARAAAGMPAARDVACRQVGGNGAARVDKSYSGDAICADALATSEPGFLLSMAFGDCLPIIIADTRVPAVALVHAGWRGSVAGVALRAWETLAALGARPETTTAYLGPAIGPCCYQVGEDVARQAHGLGHCGENSLAHRSGVTYLDLASLNAGLLATAGVAAVRSGVCTSCRHDLFFSHRADRGRTGRFAVYVGLA